MVYDTFGAQMGGSVWAPCSMGADMSTNRAAESGAVVSGADTTGRSGAHAPSAVAATGNTRRDTDTDTNNARNRQK